MPFCTPSPDWVRLANWPVEDPRKQRPHLDTHAVDPDGADAQLSP